MKKLQLTERFGKVEEIPVDQSGKKESMTMFYVTTMSIINSGQCQPENMAHYKLVRKAVKQLTEQKVSDIILLEDANYRTLFGEESNPGVMRKYNGWMSNEATDEYIDIWESATNANIEVVKNMPKITKIRQE